MKPLSRSIFPVLTATVMVFWLSACTGESQSDAGGEEGSGEHTAMEGGGEDTGEHAEGAEASGEHREAGEGGEHDEAGESREGGGEHNEGGEAREGGEHEGEHSGEHEGEHGGEGHDEAGEESGVYIAKADTWDVVRRGARLVLSFDAESSSFIGTVENTTEQALCAIRVEVHLSTGTELGPTERVDLSAGEATTVRLATEGEAFESFTAHPEMSPCG